MPTASDHLLDLFVEMGVDVVFGIPGGAISPIYAALARRTDVRVVNAKHESGAVFLAMGYAIATGRPSVVLTTAGPGVTNALTGLASAHYDGVPVLILAGEVSRAAHGRGALQEGSAAETDVLAMGRRLTCYSAELARPDAAVRTARTAFAAMMEGRRGPAMLTLPLDVGGAEVAPALTHGSTRRVFDLGDAGCEAAAELLAHADRPLLFAGAGAKHPVAMRALVALSDRIGAPVAVTPKGKGAFPEDHPRYLGLFGFGGHESVARYLEGGVDVALVCGSRLNDFSTNAWSPLLAPSRALVQIDVDGAEIGRNYRVDLALLGRVEAILPALVERIRSPLSLAPNTSALRRETPEPSPSGALTTTDAVLAMNALCPKDAFFTADMGEHLSIALHYLDIRAERGFHTALGFGSMGSSIGVALGHQLGAPTRRTYTLCGDGGFLMYGGELATAVQLGLSATFVIVNDSRLNMCHHGILDQYGATPDLSTPEIDFAAFARAMGAMGLIFRTRADLEAALTLRQNGPLVIDLRIDREVRLRGSQRVAALRQFVDSASEARPKVGERGSSSP